MSRLSDPGMLLGAIATVAFVGEFPSSCRELARLDANSKLRMMIPLFDRYPEDADRLWYALRDETERVRSVLQERAA